MTREQDLYAPVKAFLEGQGYEVKGEVGACDVVAVRDGETPVVVELKNRFNLELVLQAVERMSVSDCIYLAVPARNGAIWKKQRRRVMKLCRLIGVGLLEVAESRSGAARVEALLDPAPYKPRANTKKRGRLLKEFSERVGDPNTGGVTAVRIVTAYRQKALRLLGRLGEAGEMRLADLRSEAGVEAASSILQKNHYGWFERTRRGVYAVSPKGREALEVYRDEIRILAESTP